MVSSVFLKFLIERGQGKGRRGARNFATMLNVKETFVRGKIAVGN